MKIQYFFFLSMFLLILLAGGIWKFKYSHKVTVQLPKIYIFQDSLAIQFEETSCSFHYFDPYGNEILYDLPATIRIRGNTSTMHPKKHFALEAGDKFRMAGLPPSKNWVLIASYLDMTFLRNTLSYDLFRAFDINNKAAQSTYVSLYLNEEYHGLYILTQRIDQQSLQLKKAKEGAVLFKEPPINFPSDEHTKRYEGFYNYLLDNNRFKNYTWASRKKMALRSYFNQRYPKYEKDNQSDLIYKLTDYIFESPDSIFTSDEQGIHTLFDLSNLIDWHLLLLLSNNSDGLKKNFYVFRASKNELFKICPWDYDHGYGRDGDAEPNPDYFLVCEKNKLLARLVALNPQGYNQQLQDRYFELKAKGILSLPSLYQWIDQYKTLLQPHTLKDRQRWPLDQNNYLKGATFEDEIQLLKDWLKKRIPKVEAHLLELANPQ